MNFGGFSTANRITALVTVLTGIGAILWSGCGGGNGRYYCDATGCYQCDGYGCTNVGPSPHVDAGRADALVTPDSPPDAVNASDSADAGADATDAVVADAADAADATDSADANTCTTSAQCTGASQECWQSQCITCGGTNGPCPCAANSDCTGGNVCAGSVCTPPVDTCVYTSDCGTGKVCANGQCVVGCPATACAAGTSCTAGACLPSATTCTTSASCSAATPYCVEGSCASSCTPEAGACAAGQYCNQGACVTDTRPQTECTTSATCNANQVCLGGYCEYTCTTNMQCALIDARIAYCGTDGVCRDAAEANPMCTKQSDCAAGKNCISNVCQ